MSSWFIEIPGLPGVVPNWEVICKDPEAAVAQFRALCKRGRNIRRSAITLVDHAPVASQLQHIQEELQTIDSIVGHLHNLQKTKILSTLKRYLESLYAEHASGSIQNQWEGMIYRPGVRGKLKQAFNAHIVSVVNSYGAKPSIAQAQRIIRLRAALARVYRSNSYMDALLPGHKSHLMGSEEISEFLSRFLDSLRTHARMDPLTQDERVLLDTPIYPIARVMQTLQSLLHNWWGLTLEELVVPVWNPEVRAYVVHESDGTPIGIWYFDLTYRKEQKLYARGWARVIANRIESEGVVMQLPIVCICTGAIRGATFNTLRLNLDALSILLHEIGHGLHVIFGKTKDANGAPFKISPDAIEFPSTLFSLLCVSPPILASMTDERVQLPTPTLLKKKLFMYLEEYTMMALFDLHIHQHVLGETPIDIDALCDALNNNSVNAHIAKQELLTRLFASSAQAGEVYTYIFGAVLSVYIQLACSKTNGLPSKELAKRLRKLFEPGATRPFIQLFRECLDKNDSWFPNPDILYGACGIVKVPRSTAAF